MSCLAFLHLRWFQHPLHVAITLLLYHGPPAIVALPSHKYVCASGCGGLSQQQRCRPVCTVHVCEREIGMNILSAGYRAKKNGRTFAIRVLSAIGYRWPCCCCCYRLVPLFDWVPPFPTADRVNSIVGAFHFHCSLLLLAISTVWPEHGAGGNSAAL